MSPAPDLAVLPLGATEQHGPHLPTDTDALIAGAVAAALVSGLDARGMTAELLPTLAFGASGEHAGFPGLASVGTEVLRSVLVELGRSVGEWAPRLAVVNAHGGNVEALAGAVAQLRDEGRDVAWYACATAAGPDDTHAGEGETSLVLALDPGRVRMDLAEPGCTRPLGEILGELRAGGVAAVAPNGVLGDPRAASADQGRALLARNRDAAVASVVRWDVGASGRLGG